MPQKQSRYGKPKRDALPACPVCTEATRLDTRMRLIQGQTQKVSALYRRKQDVMKNHPRCKVCNRLLGESHGRVLDPESGVCTACTKGDGPLEFACALCCRRYMSLDDMLACYSRCAGHPAENVVVMPTLSQRYDEAFPDRAME